MISSGLNLGLLPLSLPRIPGIRWHEDVQRRHWQPSTSSLVAPEPSHPQQPLPCADRCPDIPQTVAFPHLRSVRASPTARVHWDSDYASVFLFPSAFAVRINKNNLNESFLTCLLESVIARDSMNPIGRSPGMADLVAVSGSTSARFLLFPFQLVI